MRFKDVPLKTKLILYIVIGVLLVLAASMGVIISTVTSQEEKLAYQQSVEMSANYANKFDADMKANFAIAKTISNTMDSYGASDREEVLGILKNLLIENPNLLGTYVAYEPNAFDGKDAEFVNASGHDSTGRFVPYWNKMNGPIGLDPLLHYEHSDYYQLPKETKGDLLTEPYYYEGVFMMSYVSPIFKNGEFIGIGGVDVSLEYVDEVVSEVSTFDTGYAFMVSNTGTFLSHPTHKDWIGEKSLRDFGGEELEKASEDIKNGVGGHLETTDPTTGKTVVMFYEPVDTGNSAFVLVIPKEEMLAGVTDLRNRLLIISAVSIMFMAALAWMIARSITKPIDEIVEGFRCIAEDAVKGKLDSRADTDVEVDFREIPRGLNKILDAVIVPIRETMRVTNALAEGELKERVNLDVEGEFRELGDTLDKFSETLNTIIDDSNAVLTAFQNNDFKHPVSVHGQGDFKLLTDGIEEARRSLGRATAERREAEKALLAYAMEVEDFTSQRVLYGDIIHPDDLRKVESELERNVESGSDAYSLEYRIFTKSGELRWVDERTFVQRDLKGGVHLQGIILDITEHKKAEDALLLIEEVRKKEIHHRIKNNLQVISTLLYLESGNFEDEKVIGAFKDSQHRVKSMALVHEKLYQSEDMVSVDFADYIQNLTDYLFQSYSVRNGNISLKLDVDRIFLGMDTAVPLGIIINELVSNSLKHAFAGKDSGEINISLKRDENSTAENPEEYFLLDVRDSGVGFPEDLDFRDTDSLGLQLVVTLVDQIEGSIRLDTSKGGTEFFIWFKELKHRTKL
jgi:two-component sensor histidine kinase/methyl-accepting chemotaxis protein